MLHHQMGAGMLKGIKERVEATGHGRQAAAASEA